MTNKKQKTRPINSYDEIMKVFRQNKGLRLTTEELFKVSLRNVVRIKDKTEVDRLWNALQDNVKTVGVVCNKNNKNLPVYVRGHGRNGSGDKDLKCILANVFQRQFLIDPSNNSHPHNILKDEIEGEYEDYQVSHLFERRTNNPFLFGAPWMICYAPKILDPFTGHESKGFPELTQFFVRWAFVMNKEYIKEYNEIIIDYWNELKSYFSLPTVIYSSQRKKSMIFALAPLILSYEQKTISEREKLYNDLFIYHNNAYWRNFINQEQFIDVNGQSI